MLGQATASQSVSGVLTGTVTDPDGFVIPGASITVLSESPPRTIVSNPAGRYRIEGLPAGVHRVEAKLAGFMTRRAEVQVVAGRETTWNIVVAIRTAHSRERPVGPDPTPPALAAAVYDPILRHAFKGEVPPRLLVVSTSLIQPFAEDEDWPAQFRDIPPALKEISRTVDALRPVTLRAESLPDGARLVERPGPDDVPRISFSRAFVTSDGLHALAVYEYYCGNMCAESVLVWLHRTSTSGTFRILGRHLFWIS
jgi:hypothetical protein